MKRGVNGTNREVSEFECRQYYVNQPQQTDSGDHEARHDVWYWLTQIKPKQYLGQFYRCQPAVAEAKKTCPKANGCNSASVGGSKALLFFRSKVALAPVHP